MSTTAPYAIAPDYAGKFKPSAAKEILSAVLNEKLQGKEFSADLTTQWTKEIADEVKTRLKGEPTEPAAARAACCLARHALQCALQPRRKRRAARRFVMQKRTYHGVRTNRGVLLVCVCARAVWLSGCLAVRGAAQSSI